jgi:uroporphyrinogen-III synthase
MTVAQPLAGRRILVTRAKQQAGKLGEQLQSLGAEAIELPLIEIVPPESYEPLDAAFRDSKQYQWLIVTSANTARVLGERMMALGLSSAQLSHLSIVAIGSATASALRETGLKVCITPRQYVAEAVADAIGYEVHGQRVLLARAAVARDVIPEALRKCGAAVDVVEAYRNVVPEGAAEKLRSLLAEPEEMPDAVTFTSSSTVTNFFNLLRETEIKATPQGLKALSIGPITSRTLREHGWAPAVEAKQHDLAGLVEAAVRALAR